jgi:hypothetical protein
MMATQAKSGPLASLWQMCTALAFWMSGCSTPTAMQVSIWHCCRLQVLLMLRSFADAFAAIAFYSNETHELQMRHLLLWLDRPSTVQWLTNLCGDCDRQHADCAAAGSEQPRQRIRWAGASGG